MPPYDSTCDERLFPANLLHATWQTFAAASYPRPVCGVVYRGEPRPTCGAPLGGLDTGCLDIEPNGMLGYSTLFNHLINPRLLLNLPFMGLHCDEQTWVLVTDTQAKIDTPTQNASITSFPQTDYTPRYHEGGLKDVQLAQSMDYWGHFPVIDMEYATSAPISVGVRAWAPFLPGDTVTSMAPAAMFEVTLRNTSDAPHAGAFAVSFPGFELAPDDDARKAVCRRTLQGENLHGVLVESGQEGTAWQMSYVLGLLDEIPSRQGGALNMEGAAWAAIGHDLPEVTQGETGAALAADFQLAAGERVTLRFVLAWHAPHWRSGGAPSHIDTHQFTHMYAAHYPDALSAARLLAREHVSLFKRIVAWQDAIYSAPEIPGWLADSLINILHLIPEDSVWGQATDPIGAWCDPEDGVFGMCECPRGCPQIECIPCSFYGNIPLVYFFPRAALSTLRTYKAYQFEDGRPPWIFGGCTAREPANRPPYELALPDKGYQTVLNGACYIVMADRYWRASGDDGFLREFFASLKRCNDFSMNLRPAYGPSQVMSMPASGTDGHGMGDTEWFEAPEPGWKGYVTHAGGVRMAQVAIMRRMAEAMHDHDYVARCDAWLQSGAQALEQHLWAGSYYLNFNEPETGSKSDLVFGYQLDGQWVADWHGVPGVFPADRVQTTLETIRGVNCAVSQSGAVNYANPDGSPARVGGYGTFSYFPPELMMLAMTYMYEGKREFGLELLHKCLNNLMRWGYVWDGVNTTRGDMDTGQRAFGADYYQDMMLWAVPAALDNSPLEGPCRAEGLVARVLAAANPSGNL
jgi:uncharacterized protein (DUF608 family)